MGGDITQDKKVIAYWSKKLTKAQVNYITQGKEMLTAISLIKEFSQLLKGEVMTVLTDHKNNTWLTTEAESDRIQHQRLYLDEMGVQLDYIEGDKIIAADALSGWKQSAWMTRRTS